MFKYPKAVSFAGVALASVAAITAMQQDKRITPNDPYFRYQATLQNPGGPLKLPDFSYWGQGSEYPHNAGLDIDITRAWSITTGSKQVVVALLDDGFFYQHEDVKDNIWHNPGETGVDAQGRRKETNGVDDDHNGYVDDVMGWDFAFNDPDPDPYIFDGMDKSRIQPYWHSISAMGIIGAKGNNGIGIAGINWDVSLMLLKIGAQGIPRGEVDQHRAERAAKAIRYAVDNGARVINWSGFIDDTRKEQIAGLKAAFDYASERGVLIVSAAGNSKKDLDDPANTVYPACFDTDNNLVVANLAFDGELYVASGNYVGGSNYGLHHVHIAAPGDNFTTDVRNGLSTYRVFGGTSNAAPVVTGVAALILSVRPQLKAHELKRILTESTTKLPGLKGKIESGGVVNAYKALRLAMGG
jgi:subtilisin family serine protease